MRDKRTRRWQLEGVLTRRWHESPSRSCESRSKRKSTRRLHISKSTFPGVFNGDVTLAPGVGKRTRRLHISKSTFLWTGRHKDCRALSKWREVVKDVVAPDSCTADLVAFLQRCTTPKDTEGVTNKSHFPV